MLKGRDFTGGWNFGPEDTANYSVKELIDKILLINNIGGYTTPEIVEKPHEAVLLKLDISKAVNLLKWRPVLNFDETVNLTVEGYQDDLNGGDLLVKRIKQINHYSVKAYRNNIKWAI